ncbi:MAG: tetratricopeptide repeat protein, partial [Candidatus Binatia bacterium]
MRTIGMLAIAAMLVAGPGIGTAEMTDEERAALEASSGRSSLAEESARGSSALGGSSLAEGKKLYKEGDYTLALERLLTAHTNDPDDAEASLMLGLTYLQLDDPGKAAIHWADYVKDSEDRKLAGDVSKYVT